MIADSSGRTPEAQAALAEYAALVLAAAGVQNVTAARSHDAIAQQIDDSLTLLPYVRAPLVDIGSGGGFPAIPISIVTRHAATLIESVAKKARFLERVVTQLGLPARIVAARAETVAREPDLRGYFASATARAVGPLATVLELTIPFLAVGGIAVLQRGRPDADERRMLQDAALMLGAEFVGEERIASTDERRILLVRKVAATAERFPRRVGMPAKRPLCGAATP